MKPFQQFLSAFALASLFSTAGATVLTFDESPNASLSPDGTFIADYHGFRFGTDDIADNNWFVANNANQGGLYVSHSGEQFAAVDLYKFGAYFHDTATLPISRATPFVFDGAWFSGLYGLAFDLYDGSTLVHASTPVALTDVSTFIPSGYSGAITSIVFVAPLHYLGYFALDDLTYHDLAVTAVPEPASVPLILAGAIVMAMVGRRRNGGVAPRGHLAKALR